MGTQAIAYPPGPSNWRQALMDIQKSPIQFLSNLQKEYGNYVHYKHGPSAHVYFINDPDLIRSVLVEQNDKLARANILAPTLGRFLGNGLLLSSGPFHHSQRRAIQPVFTPSWIAHYSKSMVECVNQMMDGWYDGEIRDIAQNMHDLTMNIVYRAIFGSQPGSSQDEVRSALTVLQQYIGEALRRTPQISEETCLAAIEQLNRAVGDLIAQHRITGEGDLLSMLIDMAVPDTLQPMSDQQIRDEAVTFFVAGQETSANALAWTWYLIAQHPDVETKLRTEIHDVLGDRPPSVDDLMLLPYTTRVIKESLRLYPPAWLIGRSPTETVTLGEYLIRPDATIILSPFVLHRNPNIFPDPEQFQPDRFEIEPPRFTYVPFGGGPHLCIGQPFAMLEIALTLVALLPKYHFELAQSENVELEPLITLQPKTGIRVILRERLNNP